MPKKSWTLEHKKYMGPFSKHGVNSPQIIIQNLLHKTAVRMIKKWRRTLDSDGDHCMSSTDAVCVEYGRWSTFQDPADCGCHRCMLWRQSPVAKRPALGQASSYYRSFQGQVFHLHWHCDKLNSTIRNTNVQRPNVMPLTPFSRVRTCLPRYRGRTYTGTQEHFGQMPFLPPPITCMATGWNWTRAFVPWDRTHVHTKKTKKYIITTIKVAWWTQQNILKRKLG